ncbi:Nitrogenase iron-molybdenum cofactor biosynthesis [Hartmannibacter diazotrophicus]|uniref:Nitrogenase iron-molybdenum cofactor biosynthesis protein NifN n=1 Tax=Hartmannibacter diazotrophicus TaxID=1482074 RepID=A0A2C9D2Z6_9HYPH|nr:nitrogenase iron-molybdenum cofactor biosynthesis protein NifN [Hartmannibacter diazotrophicus]SON53845.1 Nitrogenase iron-molybdenum cofactor biosynthesis [Hartmannibacter diazotrophicus]
MAIVLPQTKFAAVNPLKSSQPLGAAFAYLGVDGAVPLFHGSQGCTSFALVLFVRHFKETIPLQTTAMDEVATVLGGADHLEEAILNLKNRAKPKFIGIATTALVETRGEDFVSDLKTIKARRTDELAGTEVVLAQTPDFEGAIEEGWTKAVTAMIEGIADRAPARSVETRRVNILPGWHLTVADIEAIRETVEAFGLEPVILPDISGALDGTVPDRWIPTTYGGTSIEDIRNLGDALHTIAIGEHMRAPAARLQDLTGVEYSLFRQLTGLKAVDRFVMMLSELSGRPVPAKIRRRRAQAQDSLLDGHFHFGGKKVAIAAEPDLLYQMSTFFLGMGAEIQAAVTTTGHSKILEHVPCETVQVGDLGDFEELARGADLLVTHSHGRQASDRLGIPLMRVGFPVFDRLGSQHRLTVLYEGTRNLIFEAANIFQSVQHQATPDELNPFLMREKDHDRGQASATGHH